MRILKFEAEWCAPCKTMDDRLKEFPIEIEHINIEHDNDNLSETYKVKNIPTFIFLDDNNNVINRITGLATRQDMLDIIYGIK